MVRFSACYVVFANLCVSIHGHKHETVYIEYLYVTCMQENLISQCFPGLPPPNPASPVNPTRSGGYLRHQSKTHKPKEWARLLFHTTRNNLRSVGKEGNCADLSTGLIRNGVIDIAASFLGRKFNFKIKRGNILIRALSLFSISVLSFYL